MKNKKIVFLSLGLLLVVATLVVSVAAWLTDTATTAETSFTVGDVSYEISGGFIEKEDPIVPGEELIDEEFQLTNASTVTSELRVSINITRKIGTADPIAVTHEQLNEIFSTEGIKEGASFSLDVGWDYDEETEFWYYYGVVGLPDNPETGTDPVIPAVQEGENVMPIKFLSSLMFDGYTVGNEYSIDIFVFTFTFQAKQHEYIGWDKLGSISFGLGT